MTASPHKSIVGNCGINRSSSCSTTTTTTNQGDIYASTVSTDVQFQTNTSDRIVETMQDKNKNNASRIVNISNVDSNNSNNTPNNIVPLSSLLNKSNKQKQIRVKRLLQHRQQEQHQQHQLMSQPPLQPSYIDDNMHNEDFVVVTDKRNVNMTTKNNRKKHSNSDDPKDIIEKTRSSLSVPLPSGECHPKIAADFISQQQHFSNTMAAAVASDEKIITTNSSSLALSSTQNAQSNSLSQNTIRSRRRHRLHQQQQQQRMDNPLNGNSTGGSKHSNSHCHLVKIDKVVGANVAAMQTISPKTWRNHKRNFVKNRKRTGLISDDSNHDDMFDDCSSETTGSIASDHSFQTDVTAVTSNLHQLQCKTNSKTPETKDDQRHNLHSSDNAVATTRYHLVSTTAVIGKTRATTSTSMSSSSMDCSCDSKSRVSLKYSASSRVMEEEGVAKTPSSRTEKKLSPKREQQQRAPQQAVNIMVLNNNNNNHYEFTESDCSSDDVNDAEEEDEDELHDEMCVNHHVDIPRHQRKKLAKHHMQDQRQQQQDNKEHQQQDNQARHDFGSMFQSSILSTVINMDNIYALQHTVSETMEESAQAVVGVVDKMADDFGDLILGSEGP